MCVNKNTGEKKLFHKVSEIDKDVEAAVKGRTEVFSYGHSGGVLLDDYDVKNAIKNIIANGKEAE